MSGHKRDLLAMLGAFVVGSLTVFQSRINGQLGISLNDGFFAAWLSFGVGLLAVLVIVAVVPSFRASLGSLRAAVRPNAQGKRGIQPWQLLGGLGGATFVAGQGLTIRYLGVAIFTVAVVAAQNGSSLLVDRAGLGPAGVEPITFVRLAAAVIATFGVVIAVAGKLDSPSFRLWALGFALLAGAAIAVQQAINGRVGVAAGSPWAAGVTNFVVGFAGLTIALLISRLVNPRAWIWPPAPWNEPGLWLGGFIGVAFIVMAAAVVRIIGVLMFALASILGQIVTALAVDALFPTPGSQITWSLVLGIFVTAAAVILAGVSRQVRAHKAAKSLQSN